MSNPSADKRSDPYSPEYWRGCDWNLMWACVVAGLESEQFTAVDGRPVLGYGLQVWDDMRDELAQMQEMGIEPRIPS